MNVLFRIARSLGMSMSIGLSLSGQPTLQPMKVIEVGPFYVSVGARALIDPGGRKLLVISSPVVSESASMEYGVWDIPTGLLNRHSLQPIGEKYFGFGCGGSEVGYRFQARSNRSMTDWDESSHAFLLYGDRAAEDEGPYLIDTEGSVLRKRSDDRTSVRLLKNPAGELEIGQADGSKWTLQNPKSMPLVSGITPLARIVLGTWGFQEGISDRDGGWVAAVWEGLRPNLANPHIPFIRDGERRWVVWRKGSDIPIVDVLLNTFLGTAPSGKFTDMRLSHRGDRILAHTGSTLHLIDPLRSEVVSSISGSKFLEIPSTNSVLVLSSTSEKEDVFLVAALDTGKVKRQFHLPRSLDPPLASDLEPEEEYERRLLSQPLAISKDGRWLVSGRYGRKGAHWDGFVVWDLGQGTTP